MKSMGSYGVPIIAFVIAENFAFHAFLTHNQPVLFAAYIAMILTALWAWGTR